MQIHRDAVEDTAVSYREYAPAPALRRHVACYWTLTPAEQAAPAHRVLPDGCMDLLLRVDRDGDVVASVVGTMTRAFVAPSATVTGFAGIRFRPGEALAFLDVAATDARDALLSPLDAGLGNIADLAEKIASTTPSEWPTALDTWLLSRISHARSADARVRRAVELIGAAHGSVRVSELALHVGVSERQLERAFAERVGLSPKLLARVLRLQALVGSLDSVASASAPWAGLTSTSKAEMVMGLAVLIERKELSTGYASCRQGGWRRRRPRRRNPSRSSPFAYRRASITRSATSLSTERPRSTRSSSRRLRAGGRNNPNARGTLTGGSDDRTEAHRLHLLRRSSSQLQRPVRQNVDASSSNTGTPATAPTLFQCLSM